LLQKYSYTVEYFCDMLALDRAVTLLVIVTPLYTIQNICSGVGAPLLAPRTSLSRDTTTSRQGTFSGQLCSLTCELRLETHTAPNPTDDVGASLATAKTQTRRNESAVPCRSVKKRKRKNNYAPINARPTNQPAHAPGGLVGCSSNVRLGWWQWHR
jgi:hypothetical protein